MILQRDLLPVPSVAKWETSVTIVANVVSILKEDNSFSGGLAPLVMTKA